MSTRDEVRATVRQVLADHGRLATAVDALDDDADLVRSGLTSHASVTVMLAIEDAFDLEFPPRLLTKATFSSVRAMTDAVGTLLTEGADGADGTAR